MKLRMDKIPVTPKKWSEQVKQRKAAVKKGEGDSESESGITVDDYSIHPSGARLSKNRHVVAQRERWIEHQKKLDAQEEEIQNDGTQLGMGRACKIGAVIVLTLLVAACLVNLPVLINQGKQLIARGSVEISPGRPGAIMISWEEGQEQLKRAVKSMMRKYPNQLRESWIQILASVTSTMTSDVPRQPSSVVFLTPPDIDSGFAPCLAREIGRNAHSVFYNVTKSQYTQKILELDANDFNNANSVTEIHERLLTYLKNGKVVVIKNVHLITEADRLLVLHAFCDNSAAPDKRATFLFVVPVPSRIYGMYAGTHSEASEISNEVLSSAWTTLSTDKRPALIARVSAAAVIIKPGDRCVNE